MKTIVSGSSDTTVKIWNSRLHCLQTLKGHKSQVNSVAVSNDGSFVISGSEDGTYIFWYIHKKKFIKIKNNNDRVISVAFDKKYNFCVITYPSVIFVLAFSDLKTYVSHLKTLNNNSFETIQCSAISSDGSLIIYVVDTKYEDYIHIKVHDLDLNFDLKNTIQYKPIHMDKRHEFVLSCLALSEDNSYIAFSYETNGIVYIEIIKKQNDYVWENIFINDDNNSKHTKKVNSIFFTKDGSRLVSGSEDGTIKIWKFNSNNYSPIITLINDNNEPIKSVDGYSYVDDYSHKEKISYVNRISSDIFSTFIISGSSDNTLAIWDESIGRIF